MNRYICQDLKGYSEYSDPQKKPRFGWYEKNNYLYYDREELLAMHKNIHKQINNYNLLMSNRLKDYLYKFLKPKYPKVDIRIHHSKFGHQFEIKHNSSLDNNDTFKRMLDTCANKFRQRFPIFFTFMSRGYDIYTYLFQTHYIGTVSNDGSISTNLSTIINNQ